MLPGPRSRVASFSILEQPQFRRHTEQLSVETKLAAMRAGACAVLSKPTHARTRELVLALEHATAQPRSS